MLSRRSAPHRGARGLEIIILIFGLVHTPLPQPDFHNIRHHDGDGEVCEHHDHLLRWHPEAGIADDVAVLHWHWCFPVAEPMDLSPEQSGPAVHAHVVDWQAATWEEGPQVSVDLTSRFLGPLETPSGLSFLLHPDTADTAIPTPPLPLSRTFGATFAPHADLSCLFQRWVC
jgi:hypothetical protein